MSSPVDVVCIASWNVDLVARIPQPGGKGSNAAVAAARQGARVG
jgi:ribokinase